MRSKSQQEKKKKPALDEYLENNDYSGAMTLLEFYKNTEDANDDCSMWIAYCAFHSGQYDKALKCYQDVLNENAERKEVHLYMSACYYYLQLWKEAAEEVEQGPDCPLKTRIQLYLAHHDNDDNKLVSIHQKMTDKIEDQLSIAAIQFLRADYQIATEIYKKFLLEERDNIALNVYIAMCYYKMDYYDVSLEILTVYLQSHADSVVALNLKACNSSRLYNGKAGETDLKVLQDKGYNILDNDLIKHNLVVFRNGENALQVLPPLVDLMPEARLNLVIFYLRNDEIHEAYDLMKDVEPQSTTEYILKAIVNTYIGQSTNSREHLRTAQQYFQLVGSSPTECDTIPGRECMASCFYLINQFEDVNIYLKSIKPYMQNSDEFNWNYGISTASTGDYVTAEECFESIQNEKYREDYVYVSWLCRCYIMNGKPQKAWNLYVNMESGQDTFSLLTLIANECYKMGAFFYSAKAFSILERLDSDPDLFEGKRGACVGVFQQVVAGVENKDSLKEVVKMLRSSPSNPQVEYITRIIKKWGMENGVNGI